MPLKTYTWRTRAGHNGRQAAEFVVEIVADVFHELLAAELTKNLLEAVHVALCESFILIDRRVTERFDYSGCTLTILVQHGWHLHTASVGDPRAVLYDGSAVCQLTYDFRVEDSERERSRIIATGATVGRLAISGRGPVVDDEVGAAAVFFNSRSAIMRLLSQRAAWPSRRHGRHCRQALPPFIWHLQLLP
jgi:serine/threonine protein phosphatase PrpC